MPLHTFSSWTKQKEEHARQHASPWKLGGLTPWQLGKRVYRRFDEDEVLTRSAALSYYFISALIPMLFFLVAVLGLFAQSHDLQSSLFDYARRVMPLDAFSLLQRTVREIAVNASGTKLALGLALALWSGSAGIRSLMDALNHCYRVNESRPYWRRILSSLTLIVGISALTVVALVIVLYGADITRFVSDHTGLSDVTVAIWQIAQYAVAFFFVVISLALIYYWTPDMEQRWQWITPGSLMGVLLWTGASVLFRVYLGYFNSYGRTYGSLGAVILLLFWLYITAMAILIGGEINSEIEDAAARRGHPDAKKAGEKAA